MKKNLKTQGFILLDVDVVALNNAGKSTITNYDNAVTTKTVYKNGKSYVYVSGQAWRYWWRETLQKDLGWQLSPVEKGDKTAFTATNPIEYPDDDVFGYMRAASESSTDTKGKVKKTNTTVTRISPLKNSAIVSVASVRPMEHYSTMARQEGDAVLYNKQEYSAIMKGMFSLDLNMVGTFSNYNRTGYKNLSDKLKTEALENGAIEIDDDFVVNQKLVQLPLEIRRSRAIDTISALKNLSGGAMQTSNMGDVTPKFIVLATTQTGNHPFSHIVKSTGDRDEVAALNIEGLKEVLNEYKNDFVGNVFIGRRSGFFDDEKESLRELQEEFKNILVMGTINEIIDKYCESLKEHLQ